MHKYNIGLFLLTGFVSVCASFTAAAQDNSHYRPLTLSAEAGTTGIGGAAQWRFADHLGLRAGADYFEYKDTRTIKDVDYSAKLRLLSEPVTLDVYPWSSSSFHISLGALFNQNRVTGTGTAVDGQLVTLDGQQFLASDVGTLNLRVKQEEVNPYLSIGGNFFYFDPAHHWSMGGELGVAYTGKPKVTLTRSGGVAGSNIDAAVSEEEEKIRHASRDAQFWPVLKLAINYSF
jgi:hypothetical protein